MLKLIGSYVLLSCVTNFCLSHGDLPEVDTPLGRLRGLWKTSLDGRKIAAFEGVPYAEPPVGDLRFEEPKPIPPWLGTWEANTLHTCPQVDLFKRSSVIAGSEDCLYLNVYIPAEFLDNPKNLDVLVVIHGGAFMVGNAHSASNPGWVLEKDIILVSINYRLAIFGFLSTEDGVIPGNNGMKDQVLALKWVRDNIASFGGNPNSVTIAGVSAGGASVHFHYISPLSKGLFHRGISQSGTVLAPWAIKEDPLKDAKKLAVLVGCPDKSTEDIKKCLKQRPAETLVQQIKHFSDYDMMPFAPFAPVVEKKSSQPFLDREPYWLLKEGKLLDVPWITSNTAEDGLLPAAIYFTELSDVDKKWPEILPYMLDCTYTLPESRRKAVSKEILEYYLGPGERINEKNFAKFTQILTDRLFALPAETAAKMQAKVTRSPVYHYIYNYRDAENSLLPFYSKPGATVSKIKGAAHGDDGVTFYGMAAVKPLSEQDKRLRSACLNILYSYVSTGKPSFDGTDTWQPTGHTELTYLNISGPDNLVLQKTKNMAQSDFWSKLGFLEYENINVKDEL